MSESIQWLADPLPVPIPPIDPTWLTQPVATLFAAGIAVAGALIAYAGVTKTVRSTRREVRRKEKADALADGLAALQKMARTIAQTGLMTDASIRNALVQGSAGQSMNEAADAWTIANGRLLMYGLNDVLKATEPFIQRASIAWAEIAMTPGHKADGAEILILFNKAVPAFTKAMKSLK